MKAIFLVLLLTGSAWANPLVDGARTRLGDVYSADYVAGGWAPKGKSACVDVLLSACRARGLDLRTLVQEDARRRGGYPLLRDRDIDHRWAPNLNVWFARHWRVLPVGKDYRAGDFVFWSLTGDRVADHCGVVTERRGSSGKLSVVHQFPPQCREEDCLGRWMVVGHYRH